MRITYAACILVCCLVGVMFAAQLTKAQSEAPASNLVLENELVRVTRIQETVNASFPQVVPEKNDLVVIKVPSDGTSLMTATESAEAVRFYSRGAHLDVSTENTPSSVLVVEIKRHWDAEVKVCKEPLTCVRQIRGGGTQIGETHSLFTNGFLSGFMHRLEAGGTLASSYFSAKGNDSIVYVALTPVHVNFGGTDEDLSAGQVYFTNAIEVETTADRAPAAWVVIRIHVPKA